ncbi:MAG: DUF1493 family protein [Spirosomataceae bacterium]
MNNEIFGRLVEFVYQKRGKYKKKLIRHTQVERDLYMTGDDTVEFMDAFFYHFNIDSTGFEFCRYFDEEGFGINFRWLMSKIRRVPYTKRSPHKITMGDLEECIIKKRWIDP